MLAHSNDERAYGKRYGRDVRAKVSRSLHAGAGILPCEPSRWLDKGGGPNCSEEARSYDSTNSEAAPQSCAVGSPEGQLAACIPATSTSNALRAPELSLPYSVLPHGDV